MAFSIAGLTDYTSKATQILREGVLFQNNFSEFEIQSGIYDSEDLIFLDAQPTVVAGGCGATDGGTTTLSERKISVFDMKSDESFCMQKLEAKGLNIPDVISAITKDTINKIGVIAEQSVWMGNTLGIDGWLAQFAADANTINISAATANTSTNIADRFYEMAAKITPGMLSRGIFTIYVSYATFNLYTANRINVNAYGDTESLGVNEMWLYRYNNRIKIKAVAGIIDGTVLGEKVYMLLTWPKNPVIGTDEIRTIASAKWVPDLIKEEVWLKIAYKLGTSYKYASEAVLYTITLP